MEHQFSQPASNPQIDKVFSSLHYFALPSLQNFAIWVFTKVAKHGKNAYL
jgi:hypothetical protein